jgi:hypothetical protein
MLPPPSPFDLLHPGKPPLESFAVPVWSPLQILLVLVVVVLGRFPGISQKRASLPLPSQPLPILAKRLHPQLENDNDDDDEHD